MKYLIVLIISILIQESVFSQCDSTQWAQPGTYELVRINKSTEATFISRTPLTSDQLCLIESSRNDYHFAFIDLDLYTRVKIYPKYTTNTTIER